MRVLWVTSFGPDMYRATGRNLVSTFLNSGTAGELVAFAEGMVADPPAVPAPDRVTVRHLDGDPWLDGWLRANRDIIPRALGGAAGPCQCPTAGDPHARDHKPRCVGQWFNKNAARWFRKVASLRLALAHADARKARPDALIWVDSDCVFRRKVVPAEAGRWFGSADVFYLQSARRKAIESGVIGFRTNPGGREFLSRVFRLYESGDFRAEARWDDGYIFTVVKDRGKDLKAVDLAFRTTGRAEVVPNSPLAPYLAHYKGRHGRGLGLMT